MTRPRSGVYGGCWRNSSSKIACRNLGSCAVRFGWKLGFQTCTASVGVGSLPDWQGEWIGTEMFFWHYDADMNLVLLREAVFVIERAK